MDNKELIFTKETIDFTSAEYLDFENKIRDIKGFFGSKEAYALKEFVSRIPHLNSNIVEIGSYMGRSTICLAEGAKRKYKPTPFVVAIDHFKGSEEHQKGGTHEVKELMEFGSTFMHFRKNTANYDNIIPIAESSEKVAEFWKDDIQFLFIDGDHSYDGVKRDFENFEKYIYSGGYIAIHDVEYVDRNGTLVNKFPGVNKFYNEIPKDKYEPVFDIGSSLRILRKI